ncbi:hypothetical protein F5B20DRAFT_586023 [Whalleya microplaca]|nr:hypothetical protein F5B20DRAFT_586023 [Whalleya microplaca]
MDDTKNPQDMDDSMNLEEMFNEVDDRWLTHPLTSFDQAVDRQYVRRMFIFDFPDISMEAIRKAASSIYWGLKVAFDSFPFLTGCLGPLDDPIRKDLSQLRYGKTKELREIRPENFKWQYYRNSPYDPDYQKLCAGGMPVSHWEMKEFCIAPAVVKLDEWPPVFTLQATFLKGGGLVLCFAFLQTIVDDASILLFLPAFAQGCRAEAPPDEMPDALVYRPPDLSDYKNTFANNTRDKFLEWNFVDQILAQGAVGIRGYSTRIFAIPAMIAKEWREKMYDFLTEHSLPQPVSTIDCISALALVELIQARASIRPRRRKAEQVAFFTSVNARDRLSPPLLEPFFGNMHVKATGCMKTSVGRDTSKPRSEIDEDEFGAYAAAAYRISRAAELINDEHIRKRLSFLDNSPQPNAYNERTAAAMESPYFGLEIDCIAEYGADINFGIPGAGRGYVLPRREGGDADWEIMVCLPPPVMEHFNEEMKHWAFSSVDDYHPDSYGKYGRWFGNARVKEPERFWQ